MSGNASLTPEGGASADKTPPRRALPGRATETPVILTTARCVLRGVGPGDLAALYAMATDPDAARMLILFSPGMDRDEFAAIFPPFDGRPPFRAVIRRDGACIGSIGIGAGDEPMVYYFLSPAVQGQGIATEVLDALCDWIAARFPVRAFQAEVFADNPASRRVLEKAGFAVAGPIMMASAGRGTAREPGWLMRRDAAAG